MTDAAGRDVVKPGPLIAASALTLVTIAALASSLTWDFTQLQADESFIAWAGKQVANGRVPYRDFFFHLPPAVAWGAGLLARIAGEGLVPLRLATLAFVTAATLCLFFVAKRQGLSSVAAAGVAAWLPLVHFVGWPVPGHYWFAITFLMAALAVHDPASGSRLRTLVMGALLALATLCVQTVGVFIAAAIGVLWLARARPAAGVVRDSAIGAGAVFLLAALLVTGTGALREGFEQMVLWPLTGYHGGFNETSPYDLLVPTPTRLGEVVASGDAATVVLLLLIWVVAIIAVVDHAVAARDAAAAVDWRASLAPILAAFAAFLLGRRDAQHLAIWTTPVLLGLIPILRTARARWSRVAAGTVVLFGVLFGLARFGALWASEPPSLSGILVADDRLALRLDRDLLSRLPLVRERSLPVVYLSFAGSMLYLVWSPASPPLDWVTAPSLGNHSQGDYARLARFIEDESIPYVVVSGRDHEDFLHGPSPLGPLLKEEFELFERTPVGFVYARRGFIESARDRSRIP